MPRQNKGQRDTGEPGSNGMALQIAILLVFALMLGGTTYIVGLQAFASPTPLGVPIPEAPAPQFTVLDLDSDLSQASLLERRLPEPWISELAPQPDGLPPLSNVIPSERYDYTIGLPFGSEYTEIDLSQHLSTGVEGQARFSIEQPLHAFKVSVTKWGDAKSLTAHANQIAADSADPAGSIDVAAKMQQLPRVIAAHVEFRSKPEQEGEGELVHVLYLVPLPLERSIVFDFMMKPEHLETGRRFARKVMETFTPGPRLTPPLEQLGAIPVK